MDQRRRRASGQNRPGSANDKGLDCSRVNIHILFNIGKSMHDTVTKMVSMPMFSRSMIRINTIRT